jgi:hypothetical protein
MARCPRDNCCTSRLHRDASDNFGTKLHGGSDLFISTSSFRSATVSRKIWLISDHLVLVARQPFSCSLASLPDSREQLGPDSERYE